jgi:hypothetical protein
VFRSQEPWGGPWVRVLPGEKELHVEDRTYADVSLRANAGWLAASCGLGAPATTPFAAVGQSMEVHPSTRNKDGIVRLEGLFGGSTG